MNGLGRLALVGLIVLGVATAEGPQPGESAGDEFVLWGMDTQVHLRTGMSVWQAFGTFPNVESCRTQATIGNTDPHNRRLLMVCYSSGVDPRDPQTWPKK